MVQSRQVRRGTIMAISLEELALGALEGSAGPWTLAVGAGALAVALAAGSARPVRRMAATGAIVAQRRGQLNVNLNLAGWLGSARQSWLALVAEARAEYEAGRQQAADTAPPARRPSGPPEVTPAPVAAAAVPVVESPAMPAVEPPATPELAATPTVLAPVSDGTSPAAKRDQRGRFVRRSANTNGTRSE